jgi:hypothetical protein
VSEKRGKAFRIDAELYNGTVMMTRWEHLKESMSQTPLCRGYGVNFEMACTTQEGRLAKSSSHHRVVSYSLGGMKLVVQCEADACDCRCQGADDGNVYSKAQLLARDSTSAKRYRSQGNLLDRPPSPLNIGEKHDSNCLIEIKSRDHKNRNLDDIMVQM